MGLFDKIKNMFTEEVEDDDIKVEKIKKEVTHVQIESPNASEDSYDDEIIKNFSTKFDEKDIKPVFFDDNDFKDLNLEEPEKKYEEPKAVVEKKSYNARHEVEEEHKSFKPTPIISPVYGVLDKNYHKEDIVSKNESRQDSAEPSIESIRNKAYGTLEDELENTLFSQDSVLFKQNKEETNEENQLTEIDSDALSSLTDDISKELDELLVKKEKYSDEEIKNSIKKSDKLNEEDLLGFIDSTLYKDGDDK